METVQIQNINFDDLVEALTLSIIQVIQPKEQEVWITQKEASRLTGKSIQTIKSWENVKVKVQRFKKTNPVYLKSDLEKFIKQ